MLAEVEAAKASGMESMLVVREGNAPLTEEDCAKHRVLRNGFAEVMEVL